MFIFKIYFIILNCFSGNEVFIRVSVLYGIFFRSNIILMIIFFGKYILEGDNEFFLMNRRENRYIYSDFLKNRKFLFLFDLGFRKSF